MPALEDVGMGAAALAWLGWLLLGNGRTRLSSADQVRDHGTFAFAWLMLLASLGLALLSSTSCPAATIPGPPWAARMAGACVAAPGIALREWAVRTLGDSFTQIVALRTDQALVTGGPYRFVRHPGYAGTLLTLAGLGLTLGNW